MRFFECLTAQELELLGCTPPLAAIPEPHTPIAILQGTMTAEQCDRWRQHVKVLEGCSGKYFGREGYARVSLPQLELDEKSSDFGKTLEDPELIVLQFRKEAPEMLDEFPFKRHSNSSISNVQSPIHRH